MRAIACCIALAACCATPPSRADISLERRQSLTSRRSRAGSTNPWGLAFLPDGRMLVTERPGRLRIVTRDGKLSPPVAGVPQVRASGQGGLHDVVLDRDFALQPDDLFLLRRAGIRRRAHRDGARAP